MNKEIKKASAILKKSKFNMAFTGAGISVESGIPPFRGENGLWGKYDPKVLDIDYFYAHKEECWYYIRDIFYDFFGNAQPNPAHKVLARMEKHSLLHAIVTQNIDNLHQLAGSRVVHEFHGNSNKLVCLKCYENFDVNEINLKIIPPLCPNDHSILKPDFIFFGEGIPPIAYNNSFEAARKCEACIIVGSTGEVAPASYIPHTAKQNGAFIIEINPESSLFTNNITDLHLPGKAGEVLRQLEKCIFE